MLWAPARQARPSSAGRLLSSPCSKESTIPLQQSGTERRGVWEGSRQRRHLARHVPDPGRGACARLSPCRIQEFARTVGVDRIKVQLWDCSGSTQYQAYWPTLSKVRTQASSQRASALAGHRSQCKTLPKSPQARVGKTPCGVAWQNRQPACAVSRQGPVYIPSALCLWPCSQDLDGIILVIDPQQPEQERELETFYMNFAQPHSLTIKQCLVVAASVAKEGQSYGLAGFNGGLQSCTLSRQRCHDTRVQHRKLGYNVGLQSCTQDRQCSVRDTSTHVTFVIASHACAGLQGKLRKLNQTQVTLSHSLPQAGVQVS